MASLPALLEDLLKMHGWSVTAEASLEGRSGAVYTVPLLAERGEEAIIVAGHFDDDATPAQEISDLAETVEDVGADAAVLAHLGPLEAGAAEAAAGRVVLWNRDLFARMLGEAQIADALEETPPALELDAASDGYAVAQNVSDLMPEAFRVAAVEDELVQEGPLDALAGMAALEAALAAPAVPAPMAVPPAAMPAVAPAAPAAPAAEADFLQPFPLEPGLTPPPALAQPAGASMYPTAVPEAPPALELPPVPPAPLATTRSGFAPSVVEAVSHVDDDAPRGPPSVMHTYTRPMLPVRITLADAKRKVGERLFSIARAEVVLHPVHLYDYECDLLKGASLDFDTVDGRVQVHGADKSVIDVDPDAANPEGASVLPAVHPHEVQERVLRISEDRALQLALQHVIRKHTRNIDVKSYDPNNSLYFVEKKKVEPTTDQIRLKPLGVFFRPTWRLWGANGSVDVDANDGRELSADLRGSRTGAMLIE